MISKENIGFFEGVYFLYIAAIDSERYTFKVKAFVNSQGHSSLRWGGRDAKTDNPRNKEYPGQAHPSLGQSGLKVLPPFLFSSNESRWPYRPNTGFR